MLRDVKRKNGWLFEQNMKQFKSKNAEMLEEQVRDVMRTNTFDSDDENDVLDFSTNVEMSEYRHNSSLKTIGEILLYLRHLKYDIYECYHISYLCYWSKDLGLTEY